MAFDLDRLCCAFPTAYRSIYLYANFYTDEDGDSAASMYGAGTSVYSHNSMKGYFYDAKDQLRVGDIIFSGVSTTAPGLGRDSGGVSVWIVTHVSSSSVAGVTVAGVSCWERQY